MKKVSVLLTFLVFLGLQLVQAQTQQITGTITSADDGLGVPGASIVVRGTTIGTVTDIDGNYTLAAPADATWLVYSFVGLKTQEVSIDGRGTIDIVLEADLFRLDEVIVSGVASGTPKKKLSVSVTRVDEEALKEAPATSAASALQGKVAGVTIVQASGQPGSAANIRLRGATSLRGNSYPLIIVDGVQMEGTLADINVDDIESMEVVKGAAAAALYGSKAGNGVIVVSTKRGRGLAKGETVVTMRGEYGTQDLWKKMDLATHHAYDLDDDWASETRYTKYAGATFYGGAPGQTNPDSVGILLAGSKTLSDDQYMDNPYGVFYDQLDQMMTGGNFFTFYINVQANMDKTNFSISYETSDQQGIVIEHNGYKRQNFRFNVDHWFSDKFSVSLSNLYLTSYRDEQSPSFYNLYHQSPDANLFMPNPDGTDYNLKADQFGIQRNPLYDLKYDDRDDNRTSFQGSYSFKYHVTDWLMLDGAYAFEKQDRFVERYTPVGFYSSHASFPLAGDGSMYKYYREQFAQTLQFTANFNKQFGDITTKGKLSYLYENNKWSNFDAGSNDFRIRDLPTLDAMDQDKSYVGSEQGEIVAENIFGIVDVDYKAKYIGSFLYRYDGASQFGENERWNPYFRVSGAWRITEDFDIPGISEMKVRAAYGTAGIRPPWYAQYETYNIDGGQVSKSTLGNKDLKPATVKETEIGLNVEFLERFDFEFVYSKTDAEDQLYPVPLPASTGYLTQWQNMGTLSSDVFEATLGAYLYTGQDFTWKMNLTYDRVRQEVSKLNVAPFTTGGRGNSSDPGAFYIAEGSVFGEIFGQLFITSLDQMQDQLDRLESSESIDNYTVNSDGYVIVAGTEGTINEAPMTEVDADGNFIQQKIGDANPDFRLGISNTFTYKGFTFYALLDWKQGGDIYSMTNQWNYRDNLSADMDVYGKEDAAKKTVNYYQTLYHVNDINSHFVYDGTYLKIRELSLYYSLNKEFFNFFKYLRVGVVGRNVFTFTNYPGFDPEFGSSEGNGNSTVMAWDDFMYPNFRTFSASLELKF